MHRSTFAIQMYSKSREKCIVVWPRLNSAFDAPAKSLLSKLGLKSISELNKNELKLITFKSLTDLASNYLRQLLIQNSQQSYKPLRNTDWDLKLPLKTTENLWQQIIYPFYDLKSSIEILFCAGTRSQI